MDAAQRHRRPAVLRQVDRRFRMGSGRSIRTARFKIQIGRNQTHQRFGPHAIRRSCILPCRFWIIHRKRKARGSSGIQKPSGTVSTGSCFLLRSSSAVTKPSPSSLFIRAMMWPVPSTICVSQAEVLCSLGSLCWRNGPGEYNRLGYGFGCMPHHYCKQVTILAAMHNYRKDGLTF